MLKPSVAETFSWLKEMLCRRLIWNSRFSLQFSPNNHNPEQYGVFCFYIRQVKKTLNLLYGYLQHKLFNFETNDYNFDTFWRVKQWKLSCLAASHSQMSFPVPFFMRYNRDLLQLHQIVRHISFSNALSLLSLYMLSMNACS